MSRVRKTPIQSDMFNVDAFQRCPRCRQQVQVRVIDADKRTKFTGPESSKNRYIFTDHCVSPREQTQCPGSGQLFEAETAT